MPIRLVKKQKQTASGQKPAESPSLGQLLVNTQGWVKEFKTRKATTNEAMLGMLRRSQA